MCSRQCLRLDTLYLTIPLSISLRYMSAATVDNFLDKKKTNKQQNSYSSWCSDWISLAGNIAPHLLTCHVIRNGAS